MKCYFTVTISQKFINLFVTQSPKGVVLLRNWIVSAEKQCWYPHDDVIERKLTSLSIYNNKQTRILPMLAAIFWSVEAACFLSHFPNLRGMWVRFEQLFLTLHISMTCLCLHEAARFMIFKHQINITVLLLFCQSFFQYWSVFWGNEIFIKL